MTREMVSHPFELIYAPAFLENLKAIERKYYSLIRETIEDQLLFEPDVETKNRKPLRRPIAVGGEWELRFGQANRFRVFYAVQREENRVHVLAVGEKVGNRLLVGGKEIEL